MTAETILAEIQALPRDKRSKLFAALDDVREPDDSWIPSALKLSIEQALSGRTMVLDLGKEFILQHAPERLL